MIKLQSFLMRAFAASRILAKETSEWWESLTPEQQSDYISQHPNSKFAKDATEKPSSKPAPANAPAPTGGAGGGALKPAHTDPAKWPDHVKALKLPPAWTNVKYNEDPKADLQAIGYDAKGRSQYVYSEAFSKSQSAAKFERVLELDAKFDEVTANNNKFSASKDPVKKDHGDCLSLVMKMGLRPGSTEDTGAEKQAYGATTLLPEHVVVEKGQMFLRFTGKKGVDLNLPVEDPDLQKMLLRRKKSAGEGEKLFPKVSAESLSAHTKEVTGGDFHTKDMRTRLGTKSANDLVHEMETPTSPAAYKKAVREIATKVSAKLGNTPTICLQSYIAPQIFTEWASAAGIV